jgi:hypothetical protein
MRISDPVFTKIVTDAHIEQLRGGGGPPRSARSN